LDESEFWPAFLQRTVQALAAVGGAIWVINAGTRLQLQCQINVPTRLLGNDSEETANHYRLLDYVMAANEGQLVPPLSKANEERMGGNPTRQLLVLCPLRRNGRPRGVVEIFQRPDTMPATQRGYLLFVKQMCEFGSGFLDCNWIRQQQIDHTTIPAFRWIIARVERFFAWVEWLVWPPRQGRVKR
jgi:hypothetical protein